MTENKSLHKNYCENYNGTLVELAHDVGAMTHAARAEFFGAMADYVEKQYLADMARGRVKYAAQLGEIAELLKQIKSIEDAAWGICEPKTTVVSR